MPEKIDGGLPEKIESPEDLYIYLYAAMQLEHATIPPYLMALYSIKPGSNSDARHVLRVVVVEEMLHLTLAANICNAVGGTPDLTRCDFVPCYPAYLPDGENDFKVGLAPFSKDTINTFLNIERPQIPLQVKRTVNAVARPTTQLGVMANGRRFYSIGEFYREIETGIDYLMDEKKINLFDRDHKNQIGPEYYYSGGGEIHKVIGRATAKSAIKLITEQGEGIGERMFTPELSHFYRFEQLLLGKYYVPKDTPGNPRGPSVNVDWDAVYPFKPNARLADYPDGSELRAAAEDFNKAYSNFLELLQRAFRGEPQLLIEAVPEMFKLRHKIERLIHNPMPGHDGLNAAPTFEVAKTCKAPETAQEKHVAEASA